MSDQWEELPLSKVVDPSRRITYGIVQPGPDVSPDGVPLIRGKDYSSGKVDTSSLYHVSRAIDAPYSRSKVQSGDLLFSIVGYVGLVAEVPPELSGANITQTTARISIDPAKASSQFVAKVLASPHYKSRIRKYEKGSAQPGLNLADVERLLVKLPPLAQQQRIAEILSTVDEAIEHTEELIAKTQRIKAGLMQDLFTRGVTPDGQLRPPLEEAPHLYKKSPLGWIPIEWLAQPLAMHLADIRYGTSAQSSRDEPGVPVLRIPNVDFGKLDLSDLQYQQPSRIDLARYAVQPGDIVVVRTNGNPTIVGTCAEIPVGNPTMMFASYLVRLRLNSNGMSAPFLSRFLSTSSARSFLKTRITTSAGNYNLNTTSLKELSAPLVPEAEQESISERLLSVEHASAVESEYLEKLRAVRSGLMHDLLTGSVRVDPAASTDD